MQVKINDVKCSAGIKKRLLSTMQVKKNDVKCNAGIKRLLSAMQVKK